MSLLADMGYGASLWQKQNLQYVQDNFTAAELTRLLNASLHRPPPHKSEPWLRPPEGVKFQRRLQFFRSKTKQLFLLDRGLPGRNVDEDGNTHGTLQEQGAAEQQAPDPVDVFIAAWAA